MVVSGPLLVIHDLIWNWVTGQERSPAQSLAAELRSPIASGHVLAATPALRTPASL
jgi:hypothetical protein